MAKEWKDLEQLFYPIKLSTSSHIQENLKHSKCGANLTINKQENFATRRKGKDVANDTVYTNINEDNNGDQNLLLYDEQILAREKVDKSVADDTGKRVKLLCWIMTYPNNHITKAMYIKKTWGKRCDILLFMSSKDEPLLPTVKLPVREGKDHLNPKRYLAFKHIFDNYLQKAEWFLKADDDTYVVVENLKHLLKDLDSEYKLFLGNRMINIYDANNQSYFDGGSGYVLSREALRVLKTNKSHSYSCSFVQSRAEDVKLAKCLNEHGVMFMDTRDKYERHRFFVTNPHKHILPKKIVRNTWYRRRSYYPILKGRECCSEYSISFHQSDANLMYILEYFVYHLRPYGINYKYNN